MKPLISGVYHHYDQITQKLSVGSSLLTEKFDTIIIVSENYNSNIIGTWNVKFKNK